MRKQTAYALALGLSMLAAGCGDDVTAPTDQGTPDLTAMHDFSVAPDLSGADGGGNMATLTLENYFSWCLVGVNGGTAVQTPGSETLQFPIGTVVNLSGDKAPGFFWGYWVGTAGDTGPSHDTSMTTTVTMSGNKTVQACCPTTNGGTCPPPT